MKREINISKYLQWSVNTFITSSICRIVHSDEGINIMARYERLIKIFASKEDDLFTEWARTVPQTVDVGLKRHLVCRETDGILLLNFDPDLLAVLKEVSYLKQMSRSDIPQEAIKVRSFKYL